jgi:ribonuclease P protein component
MTSASHPGGPRRQQHLKTRAQFQAAMAGRTAVRTTHFALHRLPLSAGTSSLHAGGPLPLAESQRPLFGTTPATWIGAVIPKRWAKRAVTRNTIKRQIYAVAEEFAARLPEAALVVRLRAGIDRKAFPSARSDALKQSLRSELQKLFGGAA